MSKMGGAVEAVGADLVFGQSDGFYQVLKCIELKRCQSVAFTHLLYELAVTTATCLGVFVEMGVRIPFKFFYDASRQKFHLRL